jgi:hypothetical protein
VAAYVAGGFADRRLLTPGLVRKERSGPPGSRWPSCSPVSTPSIDPAAGHDDRRWTTTLDRRGLSQPTGSPAGLQSGRTSGPPSSRSVSPGSDTAPHTYPR